VRGVMFARFPHFMQEKLAGEIRRAVHIVLQAAFFPPRRRNQRAQLRFQQRFLPLLGAHNHHQRYCMLRKFHDLRAFGPSKAAPPLCALLRFSFGHIGGDCNPSAAKSNCVLLRPSRSIGLADSHCATCLAGTPDTRARARLRSWRLAWPPAPSRDRYERPRWNWRAGFQPTGSGL